VLYVRWSPSLRLAQDGGQLSDFIDGLGPGQLVGRQVLGAPALGDIQLSMCYQKGYLEVEVIRARGLQARQGSKVLPGKLEAYKLSVYSWCLDRDSNSGSYQYESTGTNHFTVTHVLHVVGVYET
jgi:regulating synaptic membrane exocytosis protein 2